ncbi:glycerophosphodiester phosphodiesterase family protein [Pedobacter sp. GR22-6]|uniref:glycerophosphodiester phosphodiesterase family protein n=1 Tax=Pedobacter sp. GR22-6 TaxID=3127957 RepID=UPI00307F9136
MKSYFKLLCLGLLLITTAPAFAQGLANKLSAVFGKKYKGILVAAHRGDWRNAPENSIQALENCIDRGFDMMEMDVQMTRDSQLVVMHDKTIDRTTNGKGLVSAFTLEELRKFRLKNGLGRLTPHQIPTMEELMLAAKSRILINVDKGNEHLELVFKVLRETSTLDQAIVNVGDNIPYQALMAKQVIPVDAYIMAVVNMKHKECLQIIESYQSNPRSMLQPIFDTDTLASLKSLGKSAGRHLLWLNSLWPSLNGGHDDDRAVEQKQTRESWGWLINYKPVILQTDRPAELLTYLKAKGLHR